MKKISRLNFIKSLLAVSVATIATPSLATQWIVDENGNYRNLSAGSFYGDNNQSLDQGWDNQNDIIFNENYYPEAPTDNRTGQYIYSDENDSGLTTENLVIPPRITRQEINWSGPEQAGEIIVSTSDRKLWHIQSDGKAIQYEVAVGKEGFDWSGTEKVTSKREWPTWTPTADMRKRNPNLPVQIAGGPQNPMGARALYLGNTLYRIHGSNEPNTIGKAVSSGCIRMTNEDVIDLYNSIDVGASVTVKH